MTSFQTWGDDTKCLCPGSCYSLPSLNRGFCSSFKIPSESHLLLATVSEHIHVPFLLTQHRRGKASEPSIAQRCDAHSDPWLRSRL